jgi:hypothetical protein
LEEVEVEAEAASEHEGVRSIYNGAFWELVINTMGQGEVDSREIMVLLPQY